MEPGRELDALIAEKVLGLEVGWAIFGTMNWMRICDSHRFWPEELSGKKVWSKDKFKDVGEVPWDTSDPDRSKALEYQEFGYLEPKGHFEPIRVHPYSTSISAAWEIIDMFDNIDLTSMKRITPIVWSADILKGKKWHREHGVSAPHAICLAALKAVGHVF